MSYGIVELGGGEFADGGRGPRFPPETSFLELVACRTSNWSLYEYTLSEAAGPWSPLLVMGQELEALLDSAHRWPPAMALARETASALLELQSPPPSMFLPQLAKILRDELRAAPGAFRLLENRMEEPGYRAPGDWFWARPHPARQGLLQWVSDDFFLYVAERGDFAEVGGTGLEILAGPA